MTHRYFPTFCFIFVSYSTSISQYLTDFEISALLSWVWSLAIIFSSWPSVASMPILIHCWSQHSDSLCRSPFVSQILMTISNEFGGLRDASFGRLSELAPSLCHCFRRERVCTRRHRRCQKRLRATACTLLPFAQARRRYFGMGHVYSFRNANHLLTLACQTLTEGSSIYHTGRIAPT